jgi:hypothetical protein
MEETKSAYDIYVETLENANGDYSDDEVGRAYQTYMESMGYMWDSVNEEWI